jgi:hypothetical protein
MKNMFKKACCVALAAGLLIMAAPATSQAGTYIVGAKVWGAAWDSWMGKYMEEKNSNVNSAETGYGVMAGPVLGYQSEDGKWAFSGAFMALSKFNQDIKTPGGDAERDLNRGDLDLALSYSFLGNFKAFAGYKYNYYKSELDFAGYKSTVKLTGHLPTVGLGAVYPLSDRLVASAQLGLLYGIFSDVSGTDSINVTNPALGFNGQIGLNSAAMQNLNIQGGLRYQQVQVEIDDDSYGKFKDNDRFYGITLSALYMI